MLLRSIFGTLIAMLSLFRRSETLIAFAVALLVGVFFDKIYGAAMREGFAANHQNAFLLYTAADFFRFVGCALIVVVLARALASAGRLRANVNWLAWCGIIFTAFMFTFIAQATLGYYMATLIGTNTFTVINAWFSAALVWLLLLPMVGAVLMARGYTAQELPIIYRQTTGRKFVWLGGMALVVVGLTLFIPLLFLKSDNLSDAPLLALKMLSASRFVLLNMLPWLFAVAAANAIPQHRDSAAEVFE